MTKPVTTTTMKQPKMVTNISNLYPIKTQNKCYFLSMIIHFFRTLKLRPPLLELLS